MYYKYTVIRKIFELRNNLQEQKCQILTLQEAIMADENTMGFGI